MTDLDVEYADQKHDTTALIRKVNRLDKKLIRDIQVEEKRIEVKLQKRLSKIEAENDFAFERRKAAAIKAEGKEKYVLEIDSRLRDKSQVLGNKQYHLAKIEENLPQWAKQLSEIQSIVRSFGHANELRWRSKAAASLDEAIAAVKPDVSAQVPYNQLRKLRLELNALVSNEVIRELDNIKKSYVDSLNDDSVLCASNRALNEMVLESGEPVVPLPTSTWSRALVANRILQDNIKPSPPTLDCVTTMKEKGAFEMDGVVHMVDKNRPRIRSDEYQKISGLVAYRKAAADGDLDLALKLFAKVFQPCKGSKKSDMKKLPADADTFKTLMCAFKNGKVLDYDRAYRIVDMSQKWGFKPDVQLFNILIQSCEPQSRWRRALAILEQMKTSYNIQPVHSTMKIILNCCRYSVDEPAIMYETLRMHDLPQKFCYKAAQCCAGNHLSGQIIEDAIQGARASYAIYADDLGGEFDARSVGSHVSYESDDSSQRSATSADSRHSNNSSSYRDSTLRQSSSSGAGALSVEYQSSAGLASTRRRIGRVKAQVPSMKKDPQTLQIMQWKHFVGHMRDTLPVGSPCKQAMAMDSTDIAFQSKLFRSLPNIGGAMASVHELSASLNSNSEESPFSDGPTDAKLGANTKSKVFEVATSLATMTTKQLDEAVHRNINKSLEQSGFVVLTTAATSNLIQMNRGGRSDSLVRDPFEHFGSTGGTVTNVVLSPLALEAAKATTTSPPKVPANNVGANVSKRGVEVTFFEAFEGVNPLDIHPSRALYPAHAAAGATAKSAAATAATPAIYSPGSNLHVSSKSTPRDVVHSSFTQSDDALNRSLAASFDQSQTLRTKLRVVPPSSQTTSGSDLIQPVEQDVACRSGSRESTPMASSGSKRRTLLENLKASTPSSSVALSATRKLKLKIALAKESAMNDKVAFSERQRLPPQTDKVVAPIDILYNPARLPK